MNEQTVFKVASGGLSRVANDWMPATGVRAFVFDDPSLLWLDFYGEDQGFVKDSSPYEFTDFIFKKGHDFERKWITEMAGEAVHVCDREFEVHEVDKLRETVDLLERSVPLIAGPALWWAPEKIFGVPDLLVHTTWLRERFPLLQLEEEKSDHYVVFDMKFTTELDSSKKKLAFANYSTQVRIYSYILGQLQGRMPTRGFLVCRDRITNPLEVHLQLTKGALLDADLREIRDKYIDIKLNGAKYRPWTHEDVRINLSNNEDSPWHTAKIEIAHHKVAGGDTSLVYQIGQRQKTDLSSKGFSNRDSLLEVDPVSIPLEDCYGLGDKKCMLIRAVLEANRSGNVTPEHITHIPNDKAFEFYVDFETFNNLNVDFENDWPEMVGCEMIFMIGVGWEENGEWNFKSFIAEQESHEREWAMLDSFRSFMQEKIGESLTDLASNVFFHWSNAEVWQLRRAAERHSLAPENVFRKLPWFDLQKEVFLEEPIGVPGAWSYKLKKVAGALGLVEWPGDLDEGLRAMVAGWKAHQTSSPLESPEMKTVEEYNEVDCRALYEIVRWLRQQAGA